MSTDKKEFNAAIRGYHHYRKYWNPKPIKNLIYSHEVDTVILLKYWTIPEKIQTGKLEIYFSKKPGIFRSVTLPKENKHSLLEILQNYSAPLGNSKVKNQDIWKFYISFS